MKARHALLAASILLAAIRPAPAAALTIGVVAPLSGSFAILGRQVVDGAEAAAAALKDNAQIGIVTADDKCTTDGGAAAAKSLVGQNVDLVVGFLCTDALEAAVPVLEAKGIAVITPGVRAPSLSEERAAERPPVFRLGPAPHMEADAVAEILSNDWSKALFAIIDDGTVYGRDLAETVRLDMEEKGLKSVFDDTFRPGLDNQISLITRLQRAGATHVFVGGQRDDVAVIGRDAAKLGASLVIAGGEALRAAPGSVDLRAGTLMIAPVLPETLDSATEADTAIRAAGGEPEGYAVPSYAAVQIAVQAFEQAASHGGKPADLLSREKFATAIGPVAFGKNGSRTENPFVLYRYDGSKFVKVQN